MPAWNASSQRPKRDGSAWACAVRKRPHSAGVSVSETTAENTIAAISVTVNSLKNMPVMPPANTTGTNTATSEAVIETIVKPISFAPCKVASSRGMPASMWRITFSMTTIASSTTKPIAMTSAISDMLSSV